MSPSLSLSLSLSLSFSPYLSLSLSLTRLSCNSTSLFYVRAVGVPASLYFPPLQPLKMWLMFLREGERKKLFATFLVGHRITYCESRGITEHCRDAQFSWIGFTALWMRFNNRNILIHFWSIETSLEVYKPVSKPFWLNRFGHLKTNLNAFQWRVNFFLQWQRNFLLTSLAQEAFSSQEEGE